MILSELNLNPGPGTYNFNDADSYAKKRILFASIGYTKNQESENEQERRKNGSFTVKRLVQPGPGTYENVLAINLNGRYPTTYVPNTSTLRIKKTSCIQKENQNPGPGHYKTPSDFGIYVSSKFLAETKNTLIQSKS